ncbi:hypothetical protein LCGC14_2358270 [marine sediment metagenome]|uniref:Uncharacterized protein n=1 Tax=marine sediment metagenome TaxID=412755 RepID=A0A0F9EJT6_9ZZZZ
MIRITCELWPGGDERRKRLLGVVSISNDGTGTYARGNYRIMLRRGTPATGKLRCTEVFDFPRKTRSVFQLLRWALNRLHKEKNLS